MPESFNGFTKPTEGCIAQPMVAPINSTYPQLTALIESVIQPESPGCCNTICDALWPQSTALRLHTKRSHQGL
ncbi:hypothetical protein PROFUN_14147 [Planoprotostelium fungivorum]|uniref:Uncharacterized protein n=1 Tax=Planoprotostelium fungivorum TaxID=1890364 RepID=A0A2P6N1I0_9EUKA|nr:hypothetical protein PROFUN_14147 [Planoprotostelium fungivorum]